MAGKSKKQHTIAGMNHNFFCPVRVKIMPPRLHAEDMFVVGRHTEKGTYA